VGGRALWQRYDNGDNLLFRQSDFQSPADSPLFRELLAIDDAQARLLVQELVRACQGPLDDVPLLTDLLPEEKPASKAKATVAKQPALAQGSNWDFPERETGQSVAATKQAATSKMPGWVWGGIAGAAALLLLGGVLIWAMSSKSQPEKNPNAADPRQAKAKHVEPAKPPKDKIAPRPSEKRKPDDPTPPIKPKPEETPVKPADASVPVLDGPLGEVRSFTDHTADVTCVAFSPDGKRALSAGSDNSVRLWDVAGGKQIHRLDGHAGMVWSVAFSPDGKQAVSAAYDNTVRVWDLDRGEQRQIFRGHGNNPVRRAVFAPDGKQVFSAGWDRMVRQWDVENALEVRHYEGNKTNLYWMALSPDGKRVLSTGGDRDIHCWDTADGKELEPYKGNTGDVYAIEFSRDGQFVAASGGDQVVRIWRASEPAVPLHNLSGHSGPVDALSFTPDNRLLSSSHDGTIRLWDVASGKELGRYYGPEGCKMLSVAGASDGRSFLSGGSDHRVHLWRLPPADVLAAKPDDPVKEVQSFTGHDSSVRRVAFSFDGRHILSASYDNTARLWDTATGRGERVFKEFKHPEVNGVAFLPDERRALLGGEDRILRLWDWRDGHEIHALEGSKQGIYSLAVSPDGRRAATCGPELAVLLWDLEKGAVKSRLEGLGIGAARVCFSPDGRFVLAGGGQGSIGLWDVTSDEQKPRLFLGHTTLVTSVQFSPDSRLALSASRDKSLRLWDVATGKQLWRVEGSSDQIEGAALSPDGRRAVSGGTDGIVQLWDVATGKRLDRFEGHKERILDVAFSPDGRYVVSASEDKTLKLWRVPFEPFVIGRPLEIKEAVTPPPVAAKFPIPDEDTRKKWTDTIREQKYKTEYASKDSDELAKLADKLLEHGLKKTEQPEGRYVYLVEASDVAAKAGDSVLSLRALDELGKRFLIKDELPMKAAALQTAAKSVKTLSSSKTVLASVLALFAEAIQQDDYDSAEQLTKAADAVVRKAGATAKVIQPLTNEVKRLKTKYAEVKPSVAKLAEEPKDPQANRIVGSFRCFEKADWEHGLPLLALGDDAKLKALAEKDRGAPQASDARSDLGDGWWKLAATKKGAAKENMQQRAMYWYGLALSDAVGKVRDRMEATIRQHNAGNPALAWGHLDISQATLRRGSLHLSKDKKEIGTRESYAGPIEVTVLARTEKNNIRLHGGKGAYAIFNHESEAGAVELGRPDGGAKPYTGSKVQGRKLPLRPQAWYLLNWRITEEGMSAAVNGREVFSEEHKNDLSESHSIYLQTFDSDIEVLSFTVRPIGKK